MSKRTPIYPDAEGIGKIPWREAERALANQSQDVVFSAIRPLIMALPGKDSRSNIVAAAADTWPVANKALFTPFEISERRILNNVLVAVTVSGNMDIRIYKALDGKAMNASNAAASGTGNIRRGVGSGAVDFPLLLPPGHYYVGISSSGVVLKIFMENGPAVFGAYVNITASGGREMTSAYPLPDVATFGDPSGTTGFVCAALEFKP